MMGNINCSNLRNDTLQIAQLTFANGGRLGLTFCPGKKQPVSMTGGWNRDLNIDLDQIVTAGYQGVVTLMETHELHTYHVEDLPEAVRSRGLLWLHAPIRDEGLPDAAFEAQWPLLARFLYINLLYGDSLILHCKGGLGRTGLVAARFLIEALGLTPMQAIRQIRLTRSQHSIDTGAQEDYVLNRQPGAFLRKHTGLQPLALLHTTSRKESLA